MKIAIVTGSNGLVGSEAVRFLIKKKYRVLGIDNNLRKYFFGKDGDTKWQLNNLKKYKLFMNYPYDIRNYLKLRTIFKRFKNSWSQSTQSRSSVIFRSRFSVDEQGTQ